MNLTPFFLVLFLLFGLPVPAAASPAALTHFNLVLLQPSQVLEQRVADVDAMAEYVKAVEAAARSAVIKSGAQQAVGGFIVVAVRPGGRSNVWLDFDAMLDLALTQHISTAVKAVKPFEVSQGAVVFALKVATWGAKATKRVAPAPPEWKALARNGSEALEVGALVESIWAD